MGSALPRCSPKADVPLLMSWTALHPTCGNHRGLSGKESQDGDHYDDRVGYREVGVSGARDRCGGGRGGGGGAGAGAEPGGFCEGGAGLGWGGGGVNLALFGPRGGRGGGVWLGGCGPV